jgi:dihydroorotase
VEAVERGLGAPDGAEVLDASGLVVCPGLVDVHVHLREPGGEHKETILSGADAAVTGGFTSICAMPNTDPPIDDPAAVGFVRAAGMRAGRARVYPVGAVSVGLAGQRLAPVGEMVEAGAVGITDDGRPVWDAGLMRLALEYGRSFGIPVASHCEVLELSRGGSMNEGVVSTRLGLTGIPNAAEDVMIARDLFLAELTGGRLHIQHVTTGRGAALIRAAKERGVAVTAEATPHHFSLTDAAVEGYRTHAKVNPPLRSEEDRLAVLAAVADGTLDCVATDHAPHHYDEKEQAFDDAPFGLIGLETALGVAITYLVEEKHLGLADLIHRMSTAPALAFGLEAGTLARGAPADVTVLDPAARWTVDARAFRSRSRNTPFDGQELTGRAVAAVVGGVLAYRAPAD